LGLPLCDARDAGNSPRHGALLPQEEVAVRPEAPAEIMAGYLETSTDEMLERAL
jgi:hypothetical protein